MSALLAVALVVAQPDPKLPPGFPPPGRVPDLPKFEPGYTAFPDLKPPAPPEPAPTGDPAKDSAARARAQARYDRELDELVFGRLPAPPADPTPLRKVRAEQVQAGLAFLRRTQQVIAIGRWDAQFFQNYVQVAADTFKVAAELSDTPAGRVRCYEARVILMKEIERFLGARMDAALDPPQLIDQARFQRLGAEADLLRVLAEVPPAAGPCCLPCPPAHPAPILRRR